MNIDGRRRGNREESREYAPDSARVWKINRLTRDGAAEPVSRDQMRKQDQGNISFPCSANHEQDWQPYPVDLYSATCRDHTYIHTYIHIYIHVRVVY